MGQEARRLQEAGLALSSLPSPRPCLLFKLSTDSVPGTGWRASCSVLGEVLPGKSSLHFIAVEAEARSGEVTGWWATWQCLYSRALHWERAQEGSSGVEEAGDVLGPLLWAVAKGKWRSHLAQPPGRADCGRLLCYLQLVGPATFASPPSPHEGSANHSK